MSDKNYKHHFDSSSCTFLFHFFSFWNLLRYLNESKLKIKIDSVVWVMFGNTAKEILSYTTDFCTLLSFVVFFFLLLLSLFALSIVCEQQKTEIILSETHNNQFSECSTWHFIFSIAQMVTICLSFSVFLFVFLNVIIIFVDVAFQFTDS